MSKPISKSKLRDFAFTLRCEAMEACEQAHVAHRNGQPNTLAAMKERGEVKKSIAIRIEAMLDGDAK